MSNHTIGQLLSFPNQYISEEQHNINVPICISNIMHIFMVHSYRALGVISGCLQESELPLEELLKRYGYSVPSETSTGSRARGRKGSGGEEGEGGGGGERNSQASGASGSGGSGRVKRVRISVGELLEDGDMSSAGVKRVNTERSFSPRAVLESKNMHRDTMLDDPASHSLTPAEVHTTSVTVGGNCSAVAGNEAHHLGHNDRNNPITSQTQTHHSPESPPSATTNLQSPFIPAPSPPTRLREDGLLHALPLNPSRVEDTLVDTVIEKEGQLGVSMVGGTQLQGLVDDHYHLVEEESAQLASEEDPVLASSLGLGAAAVSSPTDDVTVFSTGGMMMGQPLLPDEVGAARDYVIGGSGDEVEGGIVGEGGRRGLLLGGSSGDVLLVGSLGEGEEEGEGGRHHQKMALLSPKEFDGYSSGRYAHMYMMQ